MQNMYDVKIGMKTKNNENNKNNRHHNSSFNQKKNRDKFFNKKFKLYL